MTADCVEHDLPAQCQGEVHYYAALSGSGMSYPRCEAGYDEYVDRVQPRLDEIDYHYPASTRTVRATREMMTDGKP